MKFRSSFLPSLTPVVKNLLIINVLVFIAQQVLQNIFPITDQLALHYPAAQGFESYQLVSYMFLHADFMHLFFNMFPLFMFGVMLENHWGPKRFLLYYMVTGIGAGLVQFAVAYFSIRHYEGNLDYEHIRLVYQEGLSILNQGMNYTDPNMQSLNYALNGQTIGASGAVFGILLAFGMLFPDIQLMLMFPPIPIKAKYFVMIYGAIELFMGVSNMQGDNVAHWAHLGGMVFGFFLILNWRKKGIY